MADVTILQQENSPAKVSVRTKRLDGIEGEYPVIVVDTGDDRVFIVGPTGQAGEQLLRDLREACDAVLQPAGVA